MTKPSMRPKFDWLRSATDEKCTWKFSSWFRVGEFSILWTLKLHALTKDLSRLLCRRVTWIFLHLTPFPMTFWSKTVFQFQCEKKNENISLRMYSAINLQPLQKLKRANRRRNRVHVIQSYCRSEFSLWLFIENENNDQNKCTCSRAIDCFFPPFKKLKLKQQKNRKENRGAS